MLGLHMSFKAIRPHTPASVLLRLFARKDRAVDALFSVNTILVSFQIFLESKSLSQFDTSQAKGRRWSDLSCRLAKGVILAHC